MAHRKWRNEIDTPTYNSWISMVRRCTEPSHPYYYLYGGDGITLCERWLDFDNFVDDVGFRPEGMTIDRIDNDKDYELGNTRWATPVQQRRNSRGVTLVTWNGETRCIAEWAEVTGISYTVLRGRLRAGLPLPAVFHHGSLQTREGEAFLASLKDD